MSGADLIRDLYRAFAARDHDALRTLLAPDVEWAQSPGFPNGVVRHGAEDVLRGIVGAFARDWEGWRFHPAQFIDDGTSVVVLGAYRATNRVTGKPLVSETAHVFEIAGGRVVRFRQYSDTHVIHAAMTQRAT